MTPPRNQCMGCQAGWPMVPGRPGMHCDRKLEHERDWRWGMEMVVCTKERYER